VQLQSRRSEGINQQEHFNLNDYEAGRIGRAQTLVKKPPLTGAKIDNLVKNAKAIHADNVDLPPKTNMHEEALLFMHEPATSPH
jgi:hypothetical protein